MLLELDAGENDDEPEELWRLFDAVDIACGGHAGDATSMARVLRCCADHGIRVGAHPSYPDREHFGRRTIAMAPAALAAAIAQQCAVLAALARDHGLVVEFVKPHGALYHDAAADLAIARAVVAGVAAHDVAIIGPPYGALRDLAPRYLREGFADRRTRADGTLVPRSEPDALITDPAAAVARARDLAPTIDALCVHADTPGALAIARAVHQALRG